MSNRKNIPAQARKVTLMPLTKLETSPKKCVQGSAHASGDRRTRRQHRLTWHAAISHQHEIGAKGKPTCCYLVNDETFAALEIAARHQALAARLPEEGGLWSFVASLPMDELLSLMAHCAALSLDAVQRSGYGSEWLDHAATLAEPCPTT